ncbi:hypothetical protein ACFCQI_01845 [Rhodanobacter sp. FW102-FHT14D06]|uniref:Uncharacterized protein n=2 Tax=unclassified Rhodanobacter TaxID=2621553 RepID=A0AB74US78_9GAMM
MRLRTYVAREDDGTVLPGVAYHPATQGEDYLARSLDHDTLCANALMQAIGEVRGYYPESVFPESGNSLDCKSASMARQTCDNITNRASELMTEWGFDSGEVEE